jgi:tetraprenyl-beta-curcumene synthase
MATSVQQQSLAGVSRHGNHWLAIHTATAFILANARCWSTIALPARAQLQRWREHALEIPDRQLRQIALENLRGEGFNALATATLAPHRYRPLVVNAIVALQVMCDFLDSIVEQPLNDPFAEGTMLYRALTDAVTPATHGGDYYGPTYTRGDARYLRTLVGVVRDAVTRLPSYTAIAGAAGGAAERCSQAQVYAHTEPSDAAIKAWTIGRATGTALGWREFLAGAVSSGLALHALIAVASNPRTSPTDAQAIDDLYLPICALTTLLDGLVDYEQDIQQTGHLGYIRFYEDDEALALAIIDVVRQASRRALSTQDAGHHLVTLSGIVAYHATTPAAKTGLATGKLLGASGGLGPLDGATRAILTAWRYAEQASSRCRGFRRDAS